MLHQCTSNPLVVDPPPNSSINAIVPMAAVRQRDGNDAGVSRRVRRRGIDHCPARANSASGVLSGDSDAAPTQSQAASWHPSQIRPGWFARGSGRDTDTDDEPHGRSQQEPAAQATVPPVAASQSADQPRRLLDPTARQTMDCNNPALQRLGSTSETQRDADLGHDVPATDAVSEREGGVPSDMPRRLTRSLTRHAHRLAQPDDDAATDNVASLPVGEGVFTAQDDDAVQPLHQHSRLSAHSSLGDSGVPSSQGPGALQHSSGSQRTGRSGLAGPPAAAAVQGGEQGCATATGMQRITRFFSPLTALMRAHGSQLQSQAITAAAGPPQQQERLEDEVALDEVTSAERCLASQAAASQRDRAQAEHSPLRVPPSQLAFLVPDGLQPSQHSMEVAPAAAGPAPPSSGVGREAAAANADAFASPSQHMPPPEQGQPEDDRDTENASLAAGGTAAGEAVSEDTPATAAFRRQRALALDRISRDGVCVQALPPDVLRVLIAAEVRAGDFSGDGGKDNPPYNVAGLEDAATWDQDLELNLFEVRAQPVKLHTSALDAL